MKRFHTGDCIELTLNLTSNNDDKVRCNDQSFFFNWILNLSSRLSTSMAVLKAPMQAVQLHRRHND